MPYSLKIFYFELLVSCESWENILNNMGLIVCQYKISILVAFLLISTTFFLNLCCLHKGQMLTHAIKWI